MSEQELLVEEIHTAIDTAGDRIIERANEILANASKTPSKIEPSMALKEKAARLVALGFTKAAEVRQLESIRQQNQVMQEAFEIEKSLEKIARADAQNARYYTQRYPFSKFVTSAEMDSICAKYGLIYAPVSAYMREVPAKNLLEIEDAQDLYALDAPDDFFKEGQDQIVTFSGTAKLSHTRWAPRVPVDEIIRLLKIPGDQVPTLKLSVLIAKAKGMKIPAKSQKDTLDEAYRLVSEGKMSIDQYDSLIQGILYSAQLSMSELISSVNNEPDEKSVTCPDRPELFIAAPADHFDTSSLVATGQFEMGFPLPVVDEDPIVFRKVRGGILVDSKWGIEASDPLLLNPVNN